MSNETAPHNHSVLFKSAEEAWFWCSKKNTYSKIERVCTRADIFSVVERLYRQRRLSMDQLRVMVFYGARQSRPVPSRYQERHAFFVWRDAMRILETALEKKGWVSDRIQRAVIDFSLEQALKKVSA